VRITVCTEQCSTIFKATTFSASNSSVQRARPSGLGPQARAINLASFSPSNILSTLGRACFLRSNAASRPCSTSRWRSNSMERTLTPKARAAWASVIFGAAGDSSTASRTLACRMR
jgi:hypothetical protein